MEKKFIAIGKRIQEFAVENFNSVAELERKLNKGRNALSVYVSGRNKPGPKLLNELKRLGANTNWIMTGKFIYTKDHLEELIYNSARSKKTIAEIIGISESELERWLDNLNESYSKRIYEAIQLSMREVPDYLAKEPTIKYNKSDNINIAGNDFIAIISDKFNKLENEIKELRKEIQNKNK